MGILSDKENDRLKKNACMAMHEPKHPMHEHEHVKGDIEHTKGIYRRFFPGSGKT